MRKINFTKFVIACSLISSNVHAGGFMLRDQSLSSTGLSFAGRSSISEDASSLYGNPAGIINFKERSVSAGVAHIVGSTDISGATATDAGTNKGDMLPSANIPAFHVVTPLTADLSFGFGAYGSFGLATEYEDSFQGRYFGTKSKFSDFTLQPTVAYRLDDHWSLALDVTWNKAHGELGNALLNPFSPGTNDIDVMVKGDDQAWGYGFGILYTSDLGTRIGATYHSAVSFSLKGHTQAENVPLSGSIRYRATVDITTPDLFELSVSQPLTDAVVVHASISRAGWHSFDQIRVENEGGPSSVEPQNWRDANYYAVGLSYQVNPSWLIRTGVGFDDSPQPDSTRGVRLADSDRRFYSAGARWIYSQALSVDIAYQYLQQERAKFAQSQLGAQYAAEYESHIQDFGVQANWRF